MTPYQFTVVGIRLLGAGAVLLGLVLLVVGAVMTRLGPGFSYDPATYYLHMDANYYTVISFFPWLAFGAVCALLGLVTYVLSKPVARQITRGLAERP